METALEFVRQSFIYDDYVWSIDIDKTNNQLEIRTNIGWGLGLTKEQYKEIETILQTSFEKETYIISFSYDVSGYDYWVKIMEENNYFHITIILKTDFKFDEVDAYEMDNLVDSVLSQVLDIINEGN